mmetsp:Transcript_14563/g.43595  ORF Transcript_14563/g.43595 Transcript_14563/m.43595 type:complete len:424 (-) Transcript_14563:143-1414(-)
MPTATGRCAASSRGATGCWSGTRGSNSGWPSAQSSCGTRASLPVQALQPSTCGPRSARRVRTTSPTWRSAGCSRRTRRRRPRSAATSRRRRACRRSPLGRRRRGRCTRWPGKVCALCAECGWARWACPTRRGACGRPRSSSPPATRCAGAKCRSHNYGRSRGKLRAMVVGLRGWKPLAPSRWQTTDPLATCADIGAAHAACGPFAAFCRRAYVVDGVITVELIEAASHPHGDARGDADFHWRYTERLAGGRQLRLSFPLNEYVTSVVTVHEHIDSDINKLGPEVRLARCGFFLLDARRAPPAAGFLPFCLYTPGTSRRPREQHERGEILRVERGPGTLVAMTRELAAAGSAAEHGVPRSPKRALLVRLLLLEALGRATLVPAAGPSAVEESVDRIWILVALCDEYKWLPVSSCPVSMILAWLA